MKWDCLAESQRKQPFLPQIFLYFLQMIARMTTLRSWSNMEIEEDDVLVSRFTTTPSDTRYQSHCTKAQISPVSDFCYSFPTYRRDYERPRGHCMRSRRDWSPKCRSSQRASDKLFATDLSCIRVQRWSSLELSLLTAQSRRSIAPRSSVIIPMIVATQSRSYRLSHFPLSLFA